MATFTFPTGPAEFGMATVKRFPRGYALLAYVLEKSGFPLNRVLPTKGSQIEADMKASGRDWPPQ